MPSFVADLVRRRMASPGLLPLWRDRVSVLHPLLIGVIIALIWGGIGLNLWREHRLAGATAQQVADNLVRAFGENIERTVAAADQVAEFVRDAYQRDPANFDLGSWARSRAFLNQLAGQTAIVDRHGSILRSNLGTIRPGTSVADREHYQVQKASTEDRLFIGRPVIGRVSNQLGIPFTRRLTTPDGAFDGMVVVSLNTSYLSRFYDSLSIGQGSIGLVNRQGVILARAPSRAHVIGTDLAPTMWHLLLADAAGQFRRVSDIDGIERIYSYRRLDAYELVVFVGLAVADVYAPYRHNALIYSLVGVALTAGVMVVGLLLLRQRRRLVASRRVLAATLENMAQGIFMIAPDGSVPVINQRAIDLLGLPEPLMVRQPNFQDMLDWQLSTHVFGRPETWDHALGALPDAAGSCQGEAVQERTRPNGTVLEVRTRMLPNGGAVRTFADITARKRAETGLAAARDAAEAASQARADFLMVMSHELRAPMNAIIGAASLLHDARLDELPRRYVQIIQDSSGHILQLIDDILDFSRLEIGRLALQAETFDLRAEIASAVALMTLQAQAKGVALTSSIAPDVPPLLCGDAARLRQVLINLISNGIRFTHEGGVSVRVTLLELGAETARLAFAVTDTGIGMPAEKLDRLFNVLPRGELMLSESGGGAGLGLAICRRLVEQMGGSIEGESEPGKGTIFRFDVRLPVGHVAPASLAGRTADTPSYRILVAENNGTSRLVLTRMLERRGHRVESVSDGREAVEAMQRVAFDLVLLDLMMPVTDGAEAVIALCDAAGTKARPRLIGLTGLVPAAEEIAPNQRGLDAVLAKPVTAETLLATVAVVMVGASATAAW